MVNRILDKLRTLLKKEEDIVGLTEIDKSLEKIVNINSAEKQMKTLIIALAIIVPVVTIVARIIKVKKTTRKCTHCGNYNDISDRECINCKCSL